MNFETTFTVYVCSDFNKQNQNMCGGLLHILHWPNSAQVLSNRYTGFVSNIWPLEYIGLARRPGLFVGSPGYFFIYIDNVTSLPES